MTNEASSFRIKGAIIAASSAFLLALHWYCAYRTGRFFALGAILVPMAIAYGVSIIISPPPQWPQKEFRAIHTIFLTAGCLVGALHYAVLKFGSLQNLYDFWFHARN